MGKKITAIPATISKYTASPINNPRKRRVAGYARVSTDHEDQVTSYEAQVDYYTNYIKSRDDWEFAGIYTDEGISATSTKHREGFKRMIADAKAGKIDLIVTKSVSRFARNTVDSLTTVRELKDRGVEVYFEKENIYTLDSKGELLITIMSSLAQEESRSISENVTWGHRKRFADGKVSFAYSTFMGLDKGPDGKIVVNPEQAKIVKHIFSRFLEGFTPYAIAREMTEMGIKSPRGMDHWNGSTVRRMLSNEKYKGDALLQKEFTVDFLQKKTKKNEGEVPQYYVEGNHEAIISPEVFDLVQEELERRAKTKGSKYSGVSVFSNKVKCGDCGCWYGSKVWHSTDQYRKVIYRCNHKYRGDEKCKTPHITEEEIKVAFIDAFNKVLTEKKEIIANTEIIMETLCGTEELLDEKRKKEQEMNLLADMTQAIASDNIMMTQSRDDCTGYNELVERYNREKAAHEEISKEIAERDARRERLTQFISNLKNQKGILTEFDSKLWGCMVDYVTVTREKELIFRFRNGSEITA